MAGSFQIGCCGAGLLLALAGPARAQLGPYSEPFFFRVYSPQGQLITPATPGYKVFIEDPAYHTGLLDMGRVVTIRHDPPVPPDYPRHGWHIVSSPGASRIYKYEKNAGWAALSTYYFDGATRWYLVLPSTALSTVMSAQFRVCIAHGRDTMRVFTPTRGSGFVLDSIPYQPGTYHLADERVDEQLRAVYPAARLRSGPHADWQYLQRPVPQVVAELVARLPNDDRARARRDSLHYNRRLRLADSVASGPAAPFTKSGLLKVAEPGGRVSYLDGSALLRHLGGLDYQLYRPAEVWPALPQQVVRLGGLTLDSAYVVGDTWYGIGNTSYLDYTGPDGRRKQTRPLYGRFRLHFPQEPTPAMRQRLAQANWRWQLAADPDPAATWRRQAAAPVPAK